MKRFFLIACYFFISNSSISQDFSKEFAILMSKGRSFYNAKDYKNAGLTFSSAFRLQGVVPSTNDRLRAAYSWSLGGFPDSAFSQLKLIAGTEGLTFDEVNDILLDLLDEDFTSLRNDSRWLDVKDKMFLTAYKTYMADLKDAVDENIIPHKNELDFARNLGNHSDSAYLHLTKQAYNYIKKDKFDKAFQYIKVSIDHFPWTGVFCQTMGDYYTEKGDKTRAFVYRARALNIKYKYISVEGKSLEKIDSAIRADYKELSRQSDRTFRPPDYLVSILANATMKQGLNDLSYTLLEMNINNYPNSFNGYRAMGDYYNKKGDKVKADEFNTKSWILQYKLPDNFFDSSFNVSDYLITRTENTSKQSGRKMLLPELMINNLGNQFLNKKMFSKAELLFKMNVENYPQSRNVYARISAFYKVTGDKQKEEEFNKLAQAIKTNPASTNFSGNTPIADTSYDTHVAKPVCKIHCPSVLIDEAHKNYHTATGRYKPFADLITNDGFKVIRGQTAFTKLLLQQVNAVIIASTLPIKSTEIKILNEWIREGGALLAITDHDNSHSNELLQSLGIQTPDINYTTDSSHGMFGIIFSEADKLLGNHPIIIGRDSSEKIKVVRSFTGRTIIGPGGSSVLLPLSGSAVDYMTIEPNMRSPEYMIPVQVNGLRSHGVAFTLGKGKVVVISEAAMLTAQLFPPDGRQVGMSVPDSDNKQFALNIMRWLTGYLK